MSTCFVVQNIGLIGDGGFLIVVLVSMLLLHTAAPTQYFIIPIALPPFSLYHIFFAERKCKKKN